MSLVIKMNEADYADFFQSTWWCQAECLIGHLVLLTNQQRDSVPLKNKGTFEG